MRSTTTGPAPLPASNGAWARLDHVIDKLQRRLARESDDSFRRGMHYPTRWDPFFDDYMTLEDVYRYRAGTSTFILVNSRLPLIPGSPDVRLSTASISVNIDMCRDEWFR